MLRLGKTLVRLCALAAIVLLAAVGVVCTVHSDCETEEAVCACVCHGDVEGHAHIFLPVDLSPAKVIAHIFLPVDLSPAKVIPVEQTIDLCPLSRDIFRPPAV
jgi:hypothetical protein